MLLGVCWEATTQLRADDHSRITQCRSYNVIGLKRCLVIKHTLANNETDKAIIFTPYPAYSTRIDYATLILVF